MVVHNFTTASFAGMSRLQMHTHSFENFADFKVFCPFKLFKLESILQEIVELILFFVGVFQCSGLKDD